MLFANMERVGNETGASQFFQHLPRLTTHRLDLDDEDSFDDGTYFPFEAVVAAIAVSFCRFTVRSHSSEPLGLRAFFSITLAFLAVKREPYHVIFAFQLFSYALPWIIRIFLGRRRRALAKLDGGDGPQNGASGTSVASDRDDANNRRRGGELRDGAVCLAVIAASGAASLFLCRIVAQLGFARFVNGIMRPFPFLRRVADYLFPLEEMRAAFDIVATFVDVGNLERQLSQLFFVTFNIQVGMGYLGIEFLRREQARRNQLVRMELVQADAEEGADGGGGTSPVSGSAGRQSSSSSSKGYEPGRKDDSAGRGSVRERGDTSKEEEERRGRQGKLARRFRRGAAPFIVLTVLPYMAQLIVFGNTNLYAYTCFRDDVHRAVRLNKLFEHDGHLVAMTLESANSPGVYATSMDSVVSTVYDIFNRKFFSIPKLVLLPAVIAKQPWLLVNIFPLILLADKVKAVVVAAITSEVERVNKEGKDMRAVRTKLEEFDLKNADLLQRSGYGSTRFTKRRWVKITEEIQTLDLMHALLTRTRGYFQWLQRNFVIMALVDCALATLIAAGKIVSAEIFVFARAIEDAIDLLLMRSRAESELATMMTDIDKLNGLADVWERSKAGSLLPCNVAVDYGRSHTGNLLIENLSYSRGGASVRVDNMELTPGIYALSGANGSGKSTLFRVLMSCDSNKKSIDLPRSIVFQSPMVCNFSTEQSDTADGSPVLGHSTNDEKEECAADPSSSLSIIMPSSDVVEVSQSFYWPLYTKPIDWIYQCPVSDMDELQRAEIIARVEEELMALSFRAEMSTASPTLNPEADSSRAITDPSSKEDGSRVKSSRLIEDLLEEKEDWFSELSGGQKCKVELVRKVFLAESCPKVLLIDETLAPLDPASKTLVMAKIKAFCKNSIVLVIYHNDAGDEPLVEEDHFNEDIIQQCVPSNNFFDDNLHLEDGKLVRRAVCL